MFNLRSVKFLILTFLFLSATDSYAQKLTAEDVVRKHLDSIGAKEKRDEVKNRLIAGASKFSLLRTSSSTTGTAVFASEGEKVFFGTMFASNNYPFEKIGFNGKNVNVAFISPGLRSALGNFIQNNKAIISEGVFTGALSTSWTLLDLQLRKARIELAGRKKINDRETYVLNYLRKGGSDLTIKLYFDADTFQHLRTEYRQTFSAAQGTSPNNSSRENESRHLLTEDFSDFRNENGLNLPHKYRLYLLLDGQRNTTESEWNLEFLQFTHNQNLASNSFEVEGN